MCIRDRYNWLGEMAKTSLPLTASIEYLTGYIIELTLSIDNIFVIAMIFKSFKIPKKYQHRVLFWGIVGALLFRGLMIFFGVVLIEQFKWTTYVFGAFLIFTAIRMAFSNDEEEFDPKQSWVYRTIRRVMPVTGRIDGQKFIIKKRGLIIGTPLLLALILIEFTDILFALDSIPAILAITTDPFIVFTSNIFAILGLRSMYFFVANMLDSFHYLKYSLTVILIYVGIKLVLANHYHLPLSLSLGVIATVSYTHLDVYKRQPSFLSSPPGDKKSPSCVCIFSFNCIKFPAVTDSACIVYKIHNSNKNAKNKKRKEKIKTEFLIRK